MDDYLSFCSLPEFDSFLDELEEKFLSFALLAVLKDVAEVKFPYPATARVTNKQSDYISEFSRVRNFKPFSADRLFGDCNQSVYTSAHK